MVTFYVLRNPDTSLSCGHFVPLFLKTSLLCGSKAAPSRDGQVSEPVRLRAVFSHGCRIYDNHISYGIFARIAVILQ